MSEPERSEEYIRIDDVALQESEKFFLFLVLREVRVEVACEDNIVLRQLTH